MRRIITMVFGVAAVAATLSPASPASAQTGLELDDSAMQISSIENETVTEVTLDVLGGQAVPVTLSLSATAATEVTEDMLAADGDLEADGDGPSLSERAAAGAVWYRDWSQEYVVTGASWREKHSGRVYFDQQYVWTASYRGYEGKHNCNQGWSVGFSIDVTNCATYNTKTTHVLEAWDYFKVHVLIRAIPISNSKNMHIEVRPDGSIGGWYDR